MLIDRIYNVVRAYLNTDGKGNFSPVDFNQFLHLSIIEIYDNYFFELNRLVNRENRGLISGGLQNATEKLRERVLYYHKNETLTKNAGELYFDVPSDFRYLDAIYSGDKESEPTKDHREYALLNRQKHTKPTATFPIHFLGNKRLYIKPDVNSVTFTYIREPLEPRWTFTDINGNPLFNSSANDFQDVDMHPGEETNLVVSVLRKFGVNLKEQDIVAIATRKKEEKTQNENTP